MRYIILKEKRQDGKADHVVFDTSGTGTKIATARDDFYASKIIDALNHIDVHGYSIPGQILEAKTVTPVNVNVTIEKLIEKIELKSQLFPELESLSKQVTAVILKSVKDASIELSEIKQHN